MTQTGIHRFKGFHGYAVLLHCNMLHHSNLERNPERPPAEAHRDAKEKPVSETKQTFYLLEVACMSQVICVGRNLFG